MLFLIDNIVCSFQILILHKNYIIYKFVDFFQRMKLGAYLEFLNQMQNARSIYKIHQYVLRSLFFYQDRTLIIFACAIYSLYYF